MGLSQKEIKCDLIRIVRVWDLVPNYNALETGFSRVPENSLWKNSLWDAQVITPWQETRFALEAYINHGLLLELWDMAVYYDNLEQHTKTTSLLGEPANIMNFTDYAANTDHPMSSILASYQVQSDA